MKILNNLVIHVYITYKYERFKYPSPKIFNCFVCLYEDEEESKEITFIIFSSAALFFLLST